MNTNLEIGIFAAIGVLIVIIIFWIVVTEKRLKRFFLGKKAKDLEDTIVILEKNIDGLKKVKEDMQKEIAVINMKLKKASAGLRLFVSILSPTKAATKVRNWHVKRRRRQVVFSSLYSRERMSVFAKPVKTRNPNTNFPPRRGSA